MKNKKFGVKCAISWKNKAGKNIGVEERVYCVNASSHKLAWSKVEKVVKRETLIGMKGAMFDSDWVLEIMDEYTNSYEMYEIENPDVIEIYSGLRKSSKSVRGLLKNFMPE